jgi:hypothetical protein
MSETTDFTPPPLPPASPEGVGTAQPQPPAPLPEQPVPPPPPEQSAPLEQSAPSAEPASAEPPKSKKWLTIGVLAALVIAGVTGGILAQRSGDDAEQGYQAGRVLTPMEAAYEALNVQATSYQVSYDKDADWLTVEVTGDEAISTLAGRIVSQLAGKDCRLTLAFDQDTDAIIDALEPLKCATLRLKTTATESYHSASTSGNDGVFSVLALPGLVSLQTDHWGSAKSDLAYSTVAAPDLVTLSFATRYTPVVALSTTRFPSLTTLNIADNRESKYGFDWWADELTPDRKLTAINFGPYDAEFEQTGTWASPPDGIEIEMLAEWLVDHDTCVKTLNGRPLADWKPVLAKVSQEERGAFLASALASRARATGYAVSLTKLKQAQGMPTIDGPFAVTWLGYDADTQPTYEPSATAAANGREYYGVDASRLAGRPEEIRYVVHIEFIHGDKVGEYTRSDNGEYMGDAVLGVTQVWVVDAASGVIYGPYVAASTRPPANVQRDEYEDYPTVEWAGAPDWDAAWNYVKTLL